MTLEEMKEDLKKQGVEAVTVCDPCLLRSKHYRAKTVERLPKHILLVEDEATGEVSYMQMLPDGHLGSVRD